MIWLAKFLATGFGLGRSPVAPGTVGSLLGMGYWWLLIRSGNPWVYWLIFAAGVILAVWVSGEVAQAMQKQDPPCVVIDEIAALPLALAGLDPVWWQVALGFVWFRVFDVWKPSPVREAQSFSGGVGIVLDDVLAALYACGITHLIVWALTWIRR